IPLVPSNIISAVRANYQRCLKKKRIIEYDEKIQIGENEIWVNTKLIPLKNAEGRVYRIIGTSVDLTEHRRAEEKVKEIAKLPLQNPNPVLSISSEGFVQFRNRASLSLLKAWKYQKDRPLSGDPLKLVQKVHRTKRLKQIEVDCEDKTFLFTFTPILDSNCVNVYGLDITERKKAEDKIVHLNAVLRAIRNVNLLIIHEKNPKRLIQKICDNLVETRGYQNAWIALLDDSSNLSVSAEAGIGKDFNSMVEQLKKGDLPSCGQKALIRSSVLVINRPNVDCSDCPICPIHSDNKRMTLGLKYSGKVYGLINVSVPFDIILDQEEKHLFKEIADDIAFALHNIEVEKERKQTEEKLQKSQSILDMAESVAHIGSWRWDFATNKVTWSKEMFHLFGIDEAEFNGDVEHVVSMRVHPEDLPAVQQANVAALQDHKPTPLEYRILLPDGKERIVWAEGRMVSDESELVVALVGYVQDITGRKVIEETLRESEERFRTFMKQAPVAIFVLDLDGRILLQNDLACKYTGYSEEELSTMNISEIDHEVISKEHRKIYWDKLNINEYTKFEGVHRRKDNSTYPAEIQIVKIIFRQQQMILGFFSDITER
ncbi:PAS domain S-box protein, partial [bacterium]|nr:PAS domain S-box protein [bacterium]